MKNLNSLITIVFVSLILIYAPAAESNTIKILALGDSYTIGEGVNEKGRWPVQLRRRLEEKGLPIETVKIIAHTGWTTRDLIYAIRGENTKKSYDLVTLLIGVNDQYQKRLISAYKKDFDRLLNQAVDFAGGDAGKVIVISIPDWGVSPFGRLQNKQAIADDINQFNQHAQARTLHIEANWINITDISRESTNREMFAADGLHPSRKMYKIWTDIIFPVAYAIINTSEETQNTAIARVYDHLINETEISPLKEVHSRLQTQMNKDDFQEWEKKSKIKALETIIFEALKVQLLEEMGMKPTEDDIQLFIDFSLKQEEKRLEEFQSQRNALLKDLQAADLKEAQRNSLNKHLKTLNQLIDYEHKREEEKKLIPNYEEMQISSLKTVGTMTVTSWKFNKALYEKYGGRVIFQQAGCEPIDAYKTFLDEHRASKTFEIFDPTIDQLFQSMYEYFKMGHNFMDKDYADKYFAKPWWDPTFEAL